jgi:hypothetical protein
MSLVFAGLNALDLDERQQGQKLAEEVPAKSDR